MRPYCQQVVDGVAEATTGGVVTPDELKDIVKYVFSSEPEAVTAESIINRVSLDEDTPAELVHQFGAIIRQLSGENCHNSNCLIMRGEIIICLLFWRRRRDFRHPTPRPSWLHFQTMVAPITC